MPKTRKVQVTLDLGQYEQLQEIAEREERSLASVVRESIVRYCIEPGARRARARALERLDRVDAPVPTDYGEWEREYSRHKQGGGRSDPPGPGS